MTEHTEIENAISKENEQVSSRDFKALGLIIGTRYEWQQLALDVIEHFKVEPKVKSWVFMLCRKFPYKIVEENFKRSKDKGLRYFLACFRKSKPYEEKT